MSDKNVWVFHGAGGRFTSGVFSTKENAEDWIEKHKLTGILTLYPLDQGAYDWAITNKSFKPQKKAHYTPFFIQKFSSASQNHFHYFEGKMDFGEYE